MAKFIPKIIEPVLNYSPSEGVQEATSYASKAIRAKIILDREVRGFQKTDIRGPREAYDQGPKGGEEAPHKSQLGQPRTSSGYTSETPNRLSRVGKYPKDYISIVDLDYNKSQHGDSRYYSYVQLPFVPRELSYNPSSNFVGIASFGRNNPIYQFTGSEDTLTFNIDWFSDQNNRQDVIFNCRWIEALTKADGYEEAPHRVKIIWGDENRDLSGIGFNDEIDFKNPNKLFEDSVWVIVAAPYKLSQFVRGYIDPTSRQYVSTGMLPQQAMQQVTFKRISLFNRTSKDIVGDIIK